MIPNPHVEKKAKEYYDKGIWKEKNLKNLVEKNMISIGTYEKITKKRY